MLDAALLQIIKSLHTVIWAFFAACVFAIPFAAWLRQFDVVLVLIAIMTFEIAILAMNSWRCPLTPIAARYTSDRRENFDIVFPEWLASRTKIIFGLLFLAVLAVSSGLWLAPRP